MAETKQLEDSREFQSAWRNAEIAVKRLLKDKPYLRDFEELSQLAHHAPYCPEVPKYIQEGTDWHQRVYSMGFDFGVKESLKIAGVEENQGGNPGRVRFDRASIDSAIGAAKRLQSEKDLYIFATHLGFTIDRRPPPGVQQYVVVHPDSSTETVKPFESNPTGNKITEGQKIAKELNLRYDGIQEEIGMQFTDIHGTGTTFYATSMEDARKRLREKRRLFREVEGGNPEGEELDLAVAQYRAESEAISKKYLSDMEALGPLGFYSERQAITDKYNAAIKALKERFKYLEGYKPPAVGDNPGGVYKVDNIDVTIEYIRPGVHEVSFIAPKKLSEDTARKIDELIREKTGVPEKETETLGSFLPMPPQKGPPLPQSLGIRWPWRKL